MMKKFIVCLLLFFFAKSQAQTLQPKYAAYWGQTIWTYEFFFEDTSFKRTTSGHYGNTVAEGYYKLKKDTVVIGMGYEGIHGTFDQYFLLDGDSCIIELSTKYDYCVNRPKQVNVGGEVLENFEVSRKRDLPINKIVYNVTFEFLEGCETGKGDCKPVTLIRQSLNDSITILYPSGGTQSDVYLLSTDGAPHKVELHDSKTIGKGQLMLDLTGLPDGKYHTGIMSCNLGGRFELNIVTKNK